MSIVLRPYQKKVVEKMIWARGLPGNDLLSICQGAGKSVIIAAFAEKLGERVLVLAPNKELVSQNLEKLQSVTDDVSVYSAGLNSKDATGKIVIGTIQSVVKNPELFTDINVVILDECDLLPINKESMYSKTFKKMGVKKVYGLTGSPYRLDSFYRRPGGWSGYTGSVWQKAQLETVTCLKMINRFKKPFWHRMLGVINTKQLQEAGYIGELRYKDVSIVTHDQIPVNKSKTDFDLDAFDEMCHDATSSIANFIRNLPHKQTLVFCSSISQANALERLIEGSVAVTSQTSAKNRKKAITDFREGTIKVLLGVAIFIAGFDVPSLDSIVSLRPTKSLRIWSQLLGRGTRKAEGKTYCTVYDLVGNIKSLGTLESIEVKKLATGWNVLTSTYPEGMNGVELYSHKLQKPKNRESELLW